jgi:hypothetical protein
VENFGQDITMKVGHRKGFGYYVYDFTWDDNPTELIKLAIESKARIDKSNKEYYKLQIPGARTPDLYLEEQIYQYYSQYPPEPPKSDEPQLVNKSTEGDDTAGMMWQMVSSKLSDTPLIVKRSPASIVPNSKLAWNHPERPHYYIGYTQQHTEAGCTSDVCYVRLNLGE